VNIFAESGTHLGGFRDITITGIFAEYSGIRFINIEAGKIVEYGVDADNPGLSKKAF
jgi:hypothetical protein